MALTWRIFAVMVNPTSGKVASVQAMGWFHRRRDLGLRPLSDSHDEFVARPDAAALLAEAEHELTHREREHSERDEPQSLEASALSEQ